MEVLGCLLGKILKMFCLKTADCTGLRRAVRLGRRPLVIGDGAVIDDLVITDLKCYLALVGQQDVLIMPAVLADIRQHFYLFLTMLAGFVVPTFVFIGL